MNANDKIDPTEAAEILAVSRPRLRQFVRNGELSTVGKFGNTTMFLRSAVERLKAKRERAKKATRKNGHKQHGREAFRRL